MLNVKNADGSYYFPTHPSFGDPLSFNKPAPFSENQYIVNGDYLMSQKNTLAMRYFYSTDPRTFNFNTPIGGALPGAPEAVQYSNTNAVLKLTTLVTNSIVNEARVSFQRFFSQASDEVPAGWTPSNLGITPIVPSQTQGPAISFLINGFGVGGFLEPQFSPTNQIQYQDQISWSHGRHTIRAGFEFEKTQWNLDFAGLERGWLFIGSFTNLLAANNPGNIFQCLFCVSSGPVQAGGIIHAYREMNLNSFVQDDWKVSSKLTLNLGVRWEYDGTFSEKYGNLTNTWLSKLAPNSQVPTSAQGLPANYEGWVTAGNYRAHYPAPPDGVFVNTSGTGAIREHPPLSNFGPRLGFAYQAFSKLVLRGGVGVFYDRIGADRFVHAVEQGNPYATTLDYSGGAAAQFTIQNPFPNLPLGTFVQRWADPTTLKTSNLSVPFINEVSHTPLVRQYNFNLQYEFAPRWVLEAGYVGSSGINLLDYNHNINTASIASASNPINGYTTTTVANAGFRVPYIGYAPAGLQATAYDGISNYNSLQVTVRKEFSHGLTLQGAYTWSKSLTDLLDDSANSNNATDLKQQYGPSFFNRPQRFIMNYSWDIPTGHLNKFANAIIGGWNLSGVVTIQDGVPFTFIDGGAGTAYGTNGTGPTSGFGRAELAPGKTYADIATSGGIEARLGGYSGGPGYFNGAFLSNGMPNPNNAFAPAPAIMPDGVTITTQAACPTCATLFGNSGAGILLGPGQFNFDSTLRKQFNVTERVNVQFRAEFFNLFNHPQFSGINAAGGTGGVTGYVPQPLNAGSSTITTTSVNPRIIQLGLKVQF